MVARIALSRMITKKAVDHGARVRVTFKLPADVGKVAVAGDFNDWNASTTRLQKKGDVRSASVSLDPGRRYFFRYVDSDGRWFNDEDPDGFETNEFGESNCIIDLTD